MNVIGFRYLYLSIKWIRFGTDHDRILEDLRKRLSSNCTDFREEKDTLLENVAVCDEKTLEKYLETGELETEDITDLIRNRKIFPCYFGSALKMQGVQEFLEDFEKYTEEPAYPSEFGAKVFKIARDNQGNRLTYMKITGGSLKVKTILSSKKSSMFFRDKKSRSPGKKKLTRSVCIQGQNLKLKQRCRLGLSVL